MAHPPAAPRADTWSQAAVGAGVILLALALGAGALTIPSAAGYGGVGPNFLPWLVSVALAVCGALMLREALTGGFRQMPGLEEGAGQAWWPGLVWVSAGLLVNAALITTVGFVVGCTLCYLLAVQGLRRAAGQSAGMRSLGVDVASGAAIAAPVFWVFTQFLGISLPGLTTTGWI
ncbi:tripartite tricarboxylate transporter TctB family protein [Ramlibacter sp. AN1015]|uniref:tripartite tricarboxylate transporter TctB family protein n=1 Tax=Ramlibacter sp. AN1015 TaxID=3133428 RepID=UPI0030C5F9A3